jgi:hypothetical protein
MRPVMLQTETALWKTGHVAGAVDHGMQSSTISLRPGPDRGISSSYSKDPCPDRSRVLVAVTTMIRTRYSDPVDCSWCGHAACGPRRGVQKLHPLLTAGGLQMFRTLDQADVLRLIIGSTLPVAQQAWDARAPTVPLKIGWLQPVPQPKASDLHHGQRAMSDAHYLRRKPASDAQSVRHSSHSVRRTRNR